MRYPIYCFLLGILLTACVAGRENMKSGERGVTRIEGKEDIYQTESLATAEQFCRAKGLDAIALVNSTDTLIKHRKRVSAEPSWKLSDTPPPLDPVTPAPALAAAPESTPSSVRFRCQ